MTTNVVNQMPYLRTSRNFPDDDIKQLTVEINRSYVDIADKMNARTIGLFPTIKPAVNGESWFLTKNQKQQGFRKVFIVPAGLVSGQTIELGFKIETISKFSPKCYGSYTDNTNWYGIIFASSIVIPGQVSFFIALNGASTVSDNISFLIGAGAPAVQSGLVVIEWLSDV